MLPPPHRQAAGPHRPWRAASRVAWGPSSSKAPVGPWGHPPPYPPHPGCGPRWAGPAAFGPGLFSSEVLRLLRLLLRQARAHGVASQVLWRGRHQTSTGERTPRRHDDPRRPHVTRAGLSLSPPQCVCVWGRWQTGPGLSRVPQVGSDLDRGLAPKCPFTVPAADRVTFTFVGCFPSPPFLGVGSFMCLGK